MPFAPLTDVIQAPLSHIHCGSKAKVPAGLQQNAPCARQLVPHEPYEQIGLVILAFDPLTSRLDIG